jgi:hypothetical protein
LPPHTADALGAIPLAEQVAIRLGAAASFARPLLFNNTGIARRAAGDSAGARAWYQKAIDEPRTRGGDIELASAYGNLALVTDEPGRRDKLLASEAAVFERRLGPDHVMTLDARLKASIFIADPARAAALLRDLRDRYRRSHPTTAASRIHLCAYQLGWLAEERGDLAEERAELAAIRPTPASRAWSRRPTSRCSRARSIRPCATAAPPPIASRPSGGPGSTRSTR